MHYAVHGMVKLNKHTNNEKNAINNSESERPQGGGVNLMWTYVDRGGGVKKLDLLVTILKG